VIGRFGRRARPRQFSVTNPPAAKRTPSRMRPAACAPPAMRGQGRRNTQPTHLIRTYNTPVATGRSPVEQRNSHLQLGRPTTACSHSRKNGRHSKHIARNHRQRWCIRDAIGSTRKISRDRRRRLDAATHFGPVVMASQAATSANRPTRRAAAAGLTCTAKLCIPARRYNASMSSTLASVAGSTSPAHHIDLNNITSMPCPPKR